MRYSHALLFALLVGLGVPQVSAHAAEPEPKATIDPAPFGKLLVMFNGRVTTFDHIARNAVFEISGLETWPDAQGNPQRCDKIQKTFKRTADEQGILKSFKGS